MEIIHPIVNSLIVAATACPWWIWAIWCMTVIGEVRKTEDIIGFWPKLGWTAWYGLLGADCLTLAIAVGRWAIPPSEWVHLAHQFDSFMGTWVDAQFETHFWWSLLVTLCVTPVAVVIVMVTFCSMIADVFRTRENPIQAPDPSGVHGTAGIATDDDLAAAGLTGGKWGEGIRLGYDGSGRPIRYQEGNSVCIIGPSGAGKFTDYLAFLMAEAGNKNMLVLDPACQITPMAIEEARKRGRVIVIAPYQELLPPGVAELLGPTDSLNVMAELDPQSEIFPKKCDTITDIIVPSDNTGESKEAGYFTEGARGVGSGVIMGLKLYYPEKANLAEVCNIVCIGDRIFKFAEDMEKRGNPHVLSRLSTLTAPKARESRSVADILQTARLKLKFISDPAMHAVLQTSKQWSMNDLKNGDLPTTVFLCIAETMVTHCTPFMELFLTSVSENLLATPEGKRKAVIVADEFPLFKSHVWETLFSTGRKQIEDSFGRLGAASLLSACAVEVNLAPREPITADRISKLTGRRTVVTQSISYSQQVPGADWRPGVSFPEHGQPVFDAHQVKAIGRNHFFMFAPGLVNNVIIGTRKPYWLDEEVRKRCGRDPYHLDGNANSPSGDESGGRKNKSFWRWLWEV